MSDDLNEFLRQAALRRQQRQQQKGNRPAQSTQQPQQPGARQQNTRPVTPSLAPIDIPLAEVIDDGPVPTVGKLEPTIVARTVQSDVANTDNRVNSRLKETFQHELSQFKKVTSAKPTKPLELEQSNVPPPKASAQSSAMVSSSDLKDQLRSPQTLRLAIIANEIMKRPWS